MGTFVGKLDVRAGKGTMVQWRYADGRDYQPSDDYVRAHRPAAAMQ
jgi:branched-chain amino acid transport system substrate-binding protein